MGPSNITGIKQCFEVKIRCEDRLKILTTHRKPLLPGDSEIPRLDELIKVTLQTIMHTSYFLQSRYINNPEALNIDQWIYIKNTAKNRIGILKTIRVFQSPSDPYISTIDKAIAEAKADVLESKIIILKIKERKAARLRFYNAEIQKTLRTYDYK